MSTCAAKIIYSHIADTSCMDTCHYDKQCQHLLVVCDHSSGHHSVVLYCDWFLMISM